MVSTHHGRVLMVPASRDPGAQRPLRASEWGRGSGARGRVLAYLSVRSRAPSSSPATTASTSRSRGPATGGVQRHAPDRLEGRRWWSWSPTSPRGRSRPRAGLALDGHRARLHPRRRRRPRPHVPGLAGSRAARRGDRGRRARSWCTRSSSPGSRVVWFAIARGLHKASVASIVCAIAAPVVVVLVGGMPRSTSRS